MNGPLIGSMCTGYGGLDGAVMEVLGGELAWVADNDSGAAKLLASHWPNVPNLGDLKAVDWSRVEPVDVVCAGFPCQDISYAGRGEGIQEGNRSGLWHTIARAVRTLRPGLLVLENVRAIVGRRPGLDVVLADLAGLGFDAVWTCVRASDVGAPHRRARWFCLAWPTADARRSRRREVPGGPRGDETIDGGRAAEHDHVISGAGAQQHGSVTADPAGDGRHTRRAEPARLLGGSDAALSGSAVSADASGERHRDSGPAGERGLPAAALPGAAVVDWGVYRPAIEGWERALGRPAPAPTEPGRLGQPRLSPQFVEWLMGVPAGHVTEVAGLSRNDMLRLLGNGVVPAQAAYALRLLLGRARAEVAA